MTNLAKKRAELSKKALPEVVKLVKKYSLSAVKKAVTMLYEKKIAENKLEQAKENVKKLEGELSK